MKKSISLLVFSMMAGMGWAQGPARPAITGIAFVRIYAASQDASAAFYDHDLGFTREKLKGFDRYAVSDSQWIEVAPLPTPAPGPRLETIAYTTRNAAALEKYLNAHAVPTVQKLEHGQFAVNDPEGHLVTFVQTGSVKIPATAFSPRQTAKRIIHAGIAVKSSDAEDKFYREILGFRPNWHGGPTEDVTYWISLQVPEGTDWIEYMLHGTPTPKSLGSDYHFSLGIAQMSDVVDSLARNGCTSPNCKKTQMGRDGKVQLNVFDPELTRVEYMEFKVSGPTCCSPFLGKVPGEIEDK